MLVIFMSNFKCFWDLFLIHLFWSVYVSLFLVAIVSIEIEVILHKVLLESDLQ